MVRPSLGAIFLFSVSSLAGCGEPRPFTPHDGGDSSVDGTTHQDGANPPRDAGACVPGTTRCSPDDPQRVQRCGADGSGYADDELCDAAAARECNAGRCADRCDPSATSYLGCEYWPTVTANTRLREGFDYAVALSNPQRYAVHVEITGGALGAGMSLDIAPGEVRTVTLPWVERLSQHASFDFPLPDPVTVLERNGAYRVRANGPIAAYQFNPLQYQSSPESYSLTNDASLLLPTNVLARRYLVAGYDTTFPPGGNNPYLTRFGFVSIVATAESATSVTVVTSAEVDALSDDEFMRLAPGTYSFDLARGDVLQLIAVDNFRDLTGTRVDATQPVAVFTGHDCTEVPQGREACDHLEEQLLPITAWGRRYAVSQLRARGPTEAAVVRIVSLRDGNALRFDGITAPSECAAPLAAGRYCEFVTDGSFQVEGTEPMLVLQVMQGQGTEPSFCENPANATNRLCMGDPAMVTEVPIEQYRRSYDFLVPATYTRNFVNVVAPTGATVRLDGNALSGESAPAGAGYTAWFVPVEPGAHHIEAASESDRFGLKVYGVARYTSYMYPGGLDVAAITPE